MSDRLELFVTLTLYALPGLVVGFTLHELAHAIAAVRLGDPTPRHDGRLTLDPVEHIDPLGFALLLAIGFGFAKPVVFNAMRIPSRVAQGFLAAVGPLTNLLLALVFGLGLRLLVAVDGHVTAPDGGAGGLSSISFGHGGPGFIAYFVLYQAVVVNALLFVFNLIPIPPLDGFAVFRGLAWPVLPGLVTWAESNARFLQLAGLVVLFALPSLGHGGPAGLIGDAADGVASRAFGGPSPSYVEGPYLYVVHGIDPFLNVLRA